MGGKKKKGATAAANTTPWPDLRFDTFNHLDLRADSKAARRSILDAVSH
jgi:hypothetical protein